jgi:FKBP-type peptidyl-prolyl cis-trans isomerase FkpA
MRHLVLITLLFVILNISCNKNDFCEPDQTQAIASEITQLEAYLNDNSITATKDGRGFFYITKAEGSGKNPTICSVVTVKYEGRLLDGTIFDSSNGATFRIEGLIAAWKQAIPLMKSGGSITLFVPPSLGYGASGQGPIPPNAILIFEIELLEIR